MSGRSPETPIDIHDLQLANEEAQEGWSRMHDSLLQRTPPEYLEIWGKVLGGGSKRETTEIDGTVTKSDWSWDDVNTVFDREKATEEKELEGLVHTEIIAALQAQDSFFNNSRFRGSHKHMPEHSAVSTELIRAILKRFYVREDPLTDRWGPMSERQYEAEALEVIRRTILKPSYMLIEGKAKGPISSIASYDEQTDFWDQFDERKAKVETQTTEDMDSDQIFEVSQKIALENPSTYSRKEWIAILKKERKFLKEFLNAAARRTLQESRDTMLLAENISEQGIRLTSGEELRDLREQNEYTDKVAGWVREMDDITQVRRLADHLGLPDGFDGLLLTLHFFRPSMEELFTGPMGFDTFPMDVE